MRPSLLALCAILLIAPLSAAAATTTEGGSTQVKAQEACMNQWLFNGVWRARVTNLAYVPKDADHFNAWAVTISFANGTNVDALLPVTTGLNEIQLGFANGDTIGTGNMTDTTLEQQKLTYHSFPVAGQFTYTQQFGSNDVLDPNNKPTKLLITFPVADYRKTHPTDAQFWTQKTPAYDYRFKLDCSK